MSVAAEPKPTIGEHITRLVPYRPGKPIEEVQRELGLTDVVKLASNENVLGPSPLALDAIKQAASRVHLYPDATSHELREAAAAHLGVETDQLIFGNGSDDIIHLLGVTYLESGDEVVTSWPSFVRYEAAAILNEAPCHNVPLSDWTYDLDAMADRLNERTRLVFISNPNNPTGTSVTNSAVRSFMSQVPDRAIVVFDEAYFEFADRSDFPNTLEYLRDGRNVVILRTFSKAYGLAGLRLGYGIGLPETIGYLDRVREPFNVSLLAQTAGVAALGDSDFLRKTQDMVRAGKTYLNSAFDRLELPYCITDGNFIWVDLQCDCRTVFDGLLQRGVIVRTGDIFGAPTHIRVTIGTDEQNARFIAALAEALQ
jgi:histidinol-phosphate aminotransferase